MLIGNSFVGFLMTIFAFSGLVFFFESDSPSTFANKLQIWGVMVCVSLLRLIDALYWRTNLAGKAYNPRPALIRFSTGLYVTGCIWALYSVLFYSSMTTVELAATMVVLAAMSGGAGTVLSPNIKLVGFYSTALLVPMSLCALIDASGKFFVLGVLGLVFWFSIFASAFRYYHFLISTLHLKAKNNSLMEQMRIERSETVKVNKLLIASNEKLDASNAIAMFPVHGDSAVDLIQQADLTMYDQKRKQRGSIGVFNETL